MNDIESYGLIPLNSAELLEIDGGHEGIAYHVGVTVGKAIKVAGEIAAVVVLFFTPKS